MRVDYSQRILTRRRKDGNVHGKKQEYLERSDPYWLTEICLNVLIKSYPYWLTKLPLIVKEFCFNLLIKSDPYRLTKLRLIANGPLRVIIIKLHHLANEIDLIWINHPNSLVSFSFSRWSAVNPYWLINHTFFMDGPIPWRLEDPTAWFFASCLEGSAWNRTGTGFEEGYTTRLSWTSLGLGRFGAPGFPGKERWWIP